MVDVAALTVGRHTPSTRFRVRQHIEGLKSHGVHVDEFIPRVSRGQPMPWFLPLKVRGRRFYPSYAVWLAALMAARLPGVVSSRRYPVTWVQRELTSGVYALEHLLKPPFVYDVDDAIWLSTRRSAHVNRKIAERAAVVIAGNDYIADWYGQYARDVRIIPTAIDTARFTPAERRPDRFIIGWTGSHTNLPYLEAIEPALYRFLTNHPDAQLRVICNRPPDFRQIGGERLEYVPWTPEIEVTGLHDVSVGLMPLPDDQWTRGKCSFKMLQYMSCRIPSVVSPVGMNADVLNMGQIGLPATTQDDWYEALAHYYRSPSAAEDDGIIGRQIIEAHFSTAIVTQQLAAVFHALT